MITVTITRTYEKRFNLWVDLESSKLRWWKFVILVTQVKVDFSRHYILRRCGILFCLNLPHSCFSTSTSFCPPKREGGFLHQVSFRPGETGFTQIRTVSTQVKTFHPRAKVFHPVEKGKKKRKMSYIAHCTFVPLGKGKSSYQVLDTGIELFFTFSGKRFLRGNSTTYRWICMYHLQNSCHIIGI